jgi:hypothetical protein
MLGESTIAEQGDLTAHPPEIAEGLEWAVGRGRRVFGIHGCVQAEMPEGKVGPGPQRARERECPIPTGAWE